MNSSPCGAVLSLAMEKIFFVLLTTITGISDLHANGDDGPGGAGSKSFCSPLESGFFSSSVDGYGEKNGDDGPGGI